MDEALPELSDLIDLQSEDQGLMMVTGPYQSGKSTFIQSLTGNKPFPVSGNSYYEYKIANGDLSILPFGDGKQLFVLEWAGAARHDGLFENLGYFWHGQIILADGNAIQNFRAVRAIYESAAYAYEMPCIVLVRSVDSNSQFTKEEDYRQIFNMKESDMLVITGDTRDAIVVAQATLKLVELLSDSDYIRQLKANLESQSK